MTAIYIQCHDGKLTEFYLHDLVNTIQTPASPCPWSEGWEATKWSLPCSPAYQQLHPFPKQSLSLSRSQSTATGCSVCLQLINLQSMDLSIHKSFEVSQIKIYPYFLSPATLGTSTLHFSINKCKTTYIEEKQRTPNKKRSSSFFFLKQNISYNFVKDMQFSIFPFFISMKKQHLQASSIDSFLDSPGGSSATAGISLIILKQKSNNVHERKN